LELNDIFALLIAVIYVTRASAFSVSLAELLFNVLMEDVYMERNDRTEKEE
jgi:hypothetical protein